MMFMAELKIIKLRIRNSLKINQNQRHFYQTLLPSHKRAAVAALFVWLAGLPLRQPQVGDGHVVQRGHYDAAGDALGDRLVAVLRVGLVGDLIEVEVHCAFADAEYGGYLPGGLALAGPE